MRSDLIISMLGPLARFLQRLGLAGVSLELKLDTSTHPRDEDITGTLIATGLLNDYHADELTIQIYEYRTSGKNNPLVEVSSAVVASNVTLQVNEPTTLRFAIRLPETARLTPRTANSSAQAGTRLVARVKNRWKRTSSEAMALLSVSPHREVTAVCTALESLGFKETDWYSHHVTPPDADRKCGRCFLPPNALLDQIDEISLVMEPVGSDVVGTMVVNWKEHTMTERLQAMVGGNRLILPFTFDRDKLLTDGHKPNSRVIAPKLKEMIDAAMNSRTGPSATLLRPAESPEHSDQLLRPAHGAGHETGAVLVRPVGAAEIEEKHDQS